MTDLTLSLPSNSSLSEEIQPTLDASAMGLDPNYHSCATTKRRMNYLRDESKTGKQCSGSAVDPSPTNFRDRRIAKPKSFTEEIDLVQESQKSDWHLRIKEDPVLQMQD